VSRIVYHNSCTEPGSSFYHFATFYVFSRVTFLSEFRFAYETYHTRILLFKRYGGVVGGRRTWDPEVAGWSPGREAAAQQP